MKHATKGALAAVTAVALLSGGAGTLAYWTGTGSVTGGSIQSGTFTLGAPNCTTGGNHEWQFDGGDPFTIGATGSKVVPGDVISKICTLTLTTTGDHIGASIGVAGGAITGANTSLTPTVTSVITDSSQKVMTSTLDKPGVYTVRATVTVTFPETVGQRTGETGNELQGVAGALSDVVITATQTHDTAANS